MSPPLLAPLPSGLFDDPAPGTGSLVALLGEPAYREALVYFLLNVGDGDCQVLLLPPERSTGRRRLVVVDVATTRKVPSLLEELHAAGLLDPPGAAGQVRLLVAPHPHFDHIGGMADLLDRYGADTGFVEEFWEPGFFFPQPAFHALMARLEGSPIRRLQPSAGTTLFLGDVKLTVVGPGVGLRNRFDTFGVQVNDASITLMIAFPTGRVFPEQDPDNPDRVNRRMGSNESWRLLLGADAQFTSWAQATIDFPDLQQMQNSALARELRAARGTDYLRADVFKLSHHASKHGVNVELMERVDPALTLISSEAGGGRHGFPHMLALEAVREARDAVARSGATRPADHDLGIHVTGDCLDSGAPLGSIALVLPRRKSPAQRRLFRLMDHAGARVQLAAAREAR